jgi:spore coat protein X
MSSKKKKKYDHDEKDYDKRDKEESADRSKSSLDDDHHSTASNSYRDTPSHSMHDEDKPETRKSFDDWLSERNKDKSDDHGSSYDNSYENKTKEDNQMDHSYYSPKEAKPYYGYKNESHHADVVQDADQYASIDQESDELIFIKDSCNICVQTTNTQAAVSIQIALQLAIALVIRVTLADSDKGKKVIEDLLQHFDSEQTNKQKICIENSKDVNITTTDTDVAVHIQGLLQVLLTLVAKIDAF